MSERSFEPVEIAAGLWRWTSAHPQWSPGAAQESTADWGPQVGSVLYVDDQTATFIDALVPEGAPGFWRWADSRVATSARCAALSTISFHRRSRGQLVERYGASTSRARARISPGLEPVALRGAGEVSIWIPAHRALVCGDRILGAPGGGLRLCPESWLRYLDPPVSLGRLRKILHPLLKLPVERVLVSHGEPVLTDGRAALAEAIG